MTAEDDVRRRFAKALRPRIAPVRQLRPASRLALPQPATLAMFEHMNRACSFRCRAHVHCCAHPSKLTNEHTGSCQFAHCPLLEGIIHAK